MINIHPSIHPSIVTQTSFFPSTLRLLPRDPKKFPGQKYNPSSVFLVTAGPPMGGAQTISPELSLWWSSTSSSLQISELFTFSQAKPGHPAWYLAIKDLSSPCASSLETELDNLLVFLKDQKTSSKQGSQQLTDGNKTSSHTNLIRCQLHWNVIYYAGLGWTVQCYGQNKDHHYVCMLNKCVYQMEPSEIIILL